MLYLPIFYLKSTPRTKHIFLIVNLLGGGGVKMLIALFSERNKAQKTLEPHFILILNFLRQIEDCNWPN